MLEGISEDAATETMKWYKTAAAAEWKSLIDVRADFPSADQVGHVLIFNIRNNRYRLIVREAFAFNKLFVKAFLTHKEYDRKEWIKWA